MGLGKTELILLIILVLVILFFGAKKLPELARSVGQSAKELKDGFNGTTPEKKPADDSSKEA